MSKNKMRDNRKLSVWISRLLLYVHSSGDRAYLQRYFGAKVKWCISR